MIVKKKKSKLSKKIRDGVESRIKLLLRLRVMGFCTVFFFTTAKTTHTKILQKRRKVL